MSGPRFEAYEPMTLQQFVDSGERKGLAELAVQDPLDLPSTKRRDAVSWRCASLHSLKRRASCSGDSRRFRPTAVRPRTASMPPSRYAYAQRCTKARLRPTVPATSSVSRPCNANNTLRSQSRCIASGSLAIKQASVRRSPPLRSMTFIWPPCWKAASCNQKADGAIWGVWLRRARLKCDPY